MDKKETKKEVTTDVSIESQQTPEEQALHEERAAIAVSPRRDGNGALIV